MNWGWTFHWKNMLFHCQTWGSIIYDTLQKSNVAGKLEIRIIQGGLFIGTASTHEWLSKETSLIAGNHQQFFFFFKCFLNGGTTLPTMLETGEKRPKDSKRSGVCHPNCPNFWHFLRKKLQRWTIKSLKKSGDNGNWGWPWSRGFPGMIWEVTITTFCQVTRWKSPLFLADSLGTHELG